MFKVQDKPPEYRLEIREICRQHGQEHVLRSEAFTSKAVAVVAFRAEVSAHPAAYRAHEGRMARRRVVLVGPDRTPGVTR
jgi:hypothetical protein